MGTIEHKRGGRTVALDGMKILGATSGRTAVVKFCAAPNAETERLASFCTRLAARQHERLILFPEAVTVKWFHPDGSGRLGFAVDRTVALSTELRGERVAAVAMHETRHLAQEGVKMADLEAEADAQAFVTKWLRPYLSAYRATGGSAADVHFLDGRPPFRQLPNLSVVLSRTGAKAYQLNIRNRGAAWGLLS